MAVYTSVPAEALATFLAGYAVGTLQSAKGIAEGVSNSNFMVETSEGRFILTLYEHRIDFDELPFFIALMEHLADAGLPVPRPIRDRDGTALKMLEGRHACLIQYLPGVSVTRPTLAQARAAAGALAAMHRAAAHFPQERRNSLGPDWWEATAAELGPRLDGIRPGLRATVSHAIQRLEGWPTALPRGIVHADLFPDNVLMLGANVSGLIDFYFACTDYLVYDLAVFHAAWAFDADGRAPLPGYTDAILAGYEAVRPLGADERAAFPLVAQGAAMRFLLSRAQDWLAPRASGGDTGSIVQLKDPAPFVNRLAWYAANA